jgi:long-subunit acyl-CoA synthetase (AMP-forming)
VAAATAHPDRPFLGSRVTAEAPYTYLTYSASWSLVRSLAMALTPFTSASDPAHPPMPIMLLPNSPDWMLISIAMYGLSLPTVPLYSTLGAGAMSYILRQTKASLFFVDVTMLSSLASLGAREVGQVPRTLVLVGGSLPLDEHKRLEESGVFGTITTLERLYSDGDARRLELYAGRERASEASAMKVQPRREGKVRAQIARERD